MTVNLPFVTMCIGRDNLAMPATVLCAKRISECMGREFLWMDQDGIGITIYLNQLVRRTASALGQGPKFHALMMTDDVRVDPFYASDLAYEFEMAEMKGYDLTTIVPIRRAGMTNITDMKGHPMTLQEARKLKKYSRYGVDFLGGASIAFYYGEFDARYAFHEDDLKDESYYFINDQKKDVRLLPDVRVGHYKRMLLEE